MSPLRFPALLVVMLLAASVAGCLGAPDVEPPPAEDPAPTPPVTENRSVPEPLRFAGDLLPSADPMILVDGSICGPTAQCQVFTFDVTDPLLTTLVLSWGLEANDLDMHLAQDGVVLESAATLPPGRSEWLSDLTLQPGTYDIMVVGFVSTVEQFDVLVHFA